MALLLEICDRVEADDITGAVEHSNMAADLHALRRRFVPRLVLGVAISHETVGSSFVPECPARVPVAGHFASRFCQQTHPAAVTSTAYVV